jgi:hypothetical protein
MNLPLPANKTHWRTLVLSLFLALSAISLTGLSVLTLVFAIRSTSSPAEPAMLTFVLLAGGLFFGALLLLPGAYLNGRQFFNLPDINIHFPPMINEAILFIPLVLLWVLALILGQVASSSPFAAIILPTLNIAAIALPVLFFLRVAVQKLDLPSARYSWTIFGITLVIAPIAGMLLEGIVLIIFILAIGLYATTNGELAQQISLLADVFKHTNNSDAVIIASAPILFTPAGILTILAMFSVAVPAIEEAIKISALWLFADKIQHPVQGFVLGCLCGAAFALAENLGFSSTGANDWLATASLRASSVLPHMFNSGVLGWALVSAWKKGKGSYLKLGLAYTAVMLIHGTWNAISVILWLNSLTPYIQKSPHFIQDSAPFFFGWTTMILGTFLGLIYSNRALRRNSAFGVEYNEPLSSLKSGEKHGNSENID